MDEYSFMLLEWLKNLKLIKSNSDLVKLRSIAALRPDKLHPTQEITLKFE
jgi:hypothetical protein